jgi:hypothetical protein
VGVYVSGEIDGGWRLGASIALSESSRWLGVLGCHPSSLIHVRFGELLGASSRSHAAYIVNYRCHNAVSHIKISHLIDTGLLNYTLGVTVLLKKTARVHDSIIRESDGLVPPSLGR